MKIYKSYMFRNKDPIIDQLRTVMKDQDVTSSDVSKSSDVSYGTLRNWFDGPTQRPQFATAMAVARSLGYDLELVKRKHSNVVHLRRKSA